MGTGRGILNDAVAVDSYLFMFGDIPLNLMSSITGILLMTCLKKWRIKRISYATNGEICNYHQKYKQLIFSQNGKKIYNPTDTTIWLEVDNVEKSTIRAIP